MSFTIYLHTNILSGKSYVGFTSKTWHSRWLRHVWSATGNLKSRHFYFQSAIRKYGKDSWLHAVLETCVTRDEAAKAEQQWIAELETNKEGYNLTSGGESGCEMSLAVRKKLSQSKMGHSVSEETRRKLSVAKMGFKLSPEHLEKLRRAATGRIVSAETRARLSAAKKGCPGSMLGRKMAEETKRKIGEKARSRGPHSPGLCKKLSEAAKHRPPMSEATREKHRQRSTGRRHTEASKRLMSEKNKKRWTPEKRKQFSDMKRGVKLGPSKNRAFDAEADKHILAAFLAGETPVALGRKYGVGHKAILNAVRRTAVDALSLEKAKREHVRMGIQKVREARGPMVVSAETRQKMSDNGKRRFADPESKARWREARWGSEACAFGGGP